MNHINQNVFRLQNHVGILNLCVFDETHPILQAISLSLVQTTSFRKLCYILVSMFVDVSTTLGTSIEIIQVYSVRYFRGRVSNFNQSEARKHSFIASDRLKFETLSRKYRTLL